MTYKYNYETRINTKSLYPPHNAIDSMTRTRNGVPESCTNKLLRKTRPRSHLLYTRTPRKRE